jgi:hypothetical protein
MCKEIWVCIWVKPIKIVKVVILRITSMHLKNNLENIKHGFVEKCVEYGHVLLDFM